MRTAVLLMLGAVASAQGPTVEIRRVDWLRTAVIDVEAGGVVHRVGDEPLARTVPLASVLSIESPDAPELAVAERLNRIGAFDLAEPVYVQAADLARQGLRPSWSHAAALARRVTRCVETGRFEEAVALHARLAEIRPWRSELFLPDGFDIREADEHDRTVRRLHRQLLASLRGMGSPDPRPVLDRLRSAVPDSKFGPGFFGTVISGDERVVWAIDAGAFGSDQRLALADELAAALARMTDRRGQRFAVFVGTGEGERHPTSGTAPATADHKLAAESVLRQASGSFGDFEATLRLAAGVPGPKLLLALSPRFDGRRSIAGLGARDRFVVADLLRPARPTRIAATQPGRETAVGKPAMVLETVAGALVTEPELGIGSVLAEAPRPWMPRTRSSEPTVSDRRWMPAGRDRSPVPREWAHAGRRGGSRTMVRTARRRRKR